MSSPAVFEILGYKHIGVTSLTYRGHVPSSFTWPFDSPRAISYLEPSLYNSACRDIQWRMLCNGWHDNEFRIIISIR